MQFEDLAAFYENILISIVVRGGKISLVDNHSTYHDWLHLLQQLNAYGE